MDRIDLSLASLIAPDQTGADNLAFRVEHDKAVHLAREADAFYGVATDGCLSEDATNRDLGGAPPIVRVLFRPQRFLHAHLRMCFGASRNDLTLIIQQQRARAAGSDIDS